MTMLERVGSYSNEYFNSLIREYTDKSKAPESHGMNRAIHNKVGSCQYEVPPKS